MFRKSTFNFLASKHVSLLFIYLYCVSVRKARRSPTDSDKLAGAGLVVYRLRDHVENNQTGDRPPRVFHPVKEIRRPIAILRSPATALRVVRPVDS